ncbi:hypothetical protein SAMD00019534_095810, partial [Acytostelium subglobosum LB1]|uniref:hypothetical protein n=1 Tax=Acytostelium subglobosum LB1 TaxID=1410327 RepID=UPI000644AA3A
MVSFIQRMFESRSNSSNNNNNKRSKDNLTILSPMSSPQLSSSPRQIARASPSPISLYDDEDLSRSCPSSPSQISSSGSLGRSSGTRSFLRSSLDGLKRRFSLSSIPDGRSRDNLPGSPLMIGEDFVGDNLNNNNHNMEPEAYFELMDQFPEEVELLIISFLDASDLVSISMTDTKRFNDIYYYDINTNVFTRPDVKGDQVPRFSRHTASLVGKSIYMFGGFDGHGNNFELAVYNTEKETWWNVPKSALKGDLPATRTNHSAATVGSKMYIFGGNCNDQFGNYQVLGDLHVLDTNTLTWEKPVVTGDIPCARSGHCMTAIGNKLFMFGGGIWNEVDGWTHKFNDIFVFDTLTNVWTRPVTKGEIHTSTFAISFAIGRFLFIFGGGSKPRHCVTNDTYILDTESFQWISKFTPGDDGNVRARDMGTACVAGGEVYFLGGYAGGPTDYFDKLKFNSKVLTKLAKRNSVRLSSSLSSSSNIYPSQGMS